MSPLLTGPLVVRDNLSLHPTGAHLKWLNPWRDLGDRLVGPIRNVEIQYNFFSGKWLCYCDWAAEKPVENVRVENNAFADIINDERFKLPTGVVNAGNIFVKSSHGSDTPDAACEIKLAARASRTTSFRVERPGPAWLEYDKYSASRDVVELAEQWMKVANRCD